MKIKGLLRWITAAAMTAVLLGCGTALAAEEKTIAVQLNGENLTFTDAVPQVKDQRTFLPFRAVFEAMGAQVEWRAEEPDKITAVRGEKTLTMTLGETAATITEKGVSLPITMDVAPYADAGRTYVPVRFAAQAFDCAVGWDQEAYTAIIVDTGKLVEEALEGKKFTYLEKLNEYSEKYNKGIWDTKLSFDADIAVMGMPITMTGAATGTSEGSDKVSVDMNMKMDMTQYLKTVAFLTGGSVEVPDEELAMLEALKTEGIDMGIRGDMTKGTLYMNMKGALMAAAGMDADTWYKMDMAELMAQSGMDWTELMNMSGTVDYAAVAKGALSAMELSDATTGYTGMKSTLEEVLTAFSDEGFVKEGNQYTATIAMEEDDIFATVVLVMEMKRNTVTGYVMSVAVEAEQEGAILAMDMTVSMNDKDQMTAEVNMNMTGVMTLEMTMEGGYTQGKTAPVTEPPAEAAVADFMELAGLSAGDMGVIGGADGPTAVMIGQ